MPWTAATKAMRTRTGGHLTQKQQLLAVTRGCCMVVPACGSMAVVRAREGMLEGMLCRRPGMMMKMLTWRMGKEGMVAAGKAALQQALEPGVVLDPTGANVAVSAGCSSGHVWGRDFQSGSYMPRWKPCAGMHL